MVATTSTPVPVRGSGAGHFWLPALSLAILAVPTAKTLSEQVWSREFGAHGPIIIVTGLWLLWRQLDEIKRVAQPGHPALTAILLAGALGIYVFGRAYDFIMLETLGVYGVGVAMFHSHFGMRALLRTWFPFFYLAFAVPLPNWFMDQLTAPLKAFVSFAATDILQHAGIPIAREGVTLFVAQYQLLVEDACSGLNSLTGLTAISLFYIYLLRGSSWRYALFLTCLVIPIAIIANVLRIIILVLLTYFYGDATAQGFLHFTAGIFLFAASLLMVFAIDSLVFPFISRRRRAT